MESPDDAYMVPELDPDERVALERYQRSISRLTYCFDERPHALHNRSLTGRLTGCPQPVEMLMWGPVMRQEVAVVIECKQGRDAVGVRAVEDFAEKAIDIAADCGILYSVSGFTTSARARAAGMRHPAIMLLSLDRPGRNREPLVPHQRQPAQEEFLPPHDSEEVTEMDFMLYLWLRPDELN